MVIQWSMIGEFEPADWWLMSRTSKLVIDELNQLTGWWLMNRTGWLEIDEVNQATGCPLILKAPGVTQSFFCHCRLLACPSCAKASALTCAISLSSSSGPGSQKEAVGWKTEITKSKRDRKKHESSWQQKGGRQRKRKGRGWKRKEEEEFICSAAVQHFTSWAFCGWGERGVCKSCQQRHGHYARISGHLILILSFSVEPPSSLPQGKTLTTLFTKTGTVNSIDMQCLIINVCGYQDAHAWSGMSVETSWCECLILVILQHSELCNL